MTIVLRDGFDVYNAGLANVGMQASWTLFSNTSPATITNPSGRFGGQSVRFASAINLSDHRLLRAFDSPISSGTLKFAFRVTSFGFVDAVAILTLFNGTTPMIGITINSAGQLIVSRFTGTFNAANSTPARTVIGTTGLGTFALNTFYEFALEFVISDTVGEIRLIRNGLDTVLSLTNQDTRNGTPTTIDNLHVGVTTSVNGGGPTYELDDLICSNTFDGALGERIETLFATSDGGTLNFVPSTGTSHFALVDEVPVNITDYLSGSVVGDIDLLGLGNLSSTPSAIREVNIITFAQKTDATVRAINNGVKSGVTIANGPNLSLAVGFAKYQNPIALDPNTGAAWTPAAVNALELQPRIAV